MTTTTNPCHHDLSELRRQLAEARQHRGFWGNRYRCLSPRRNQDKYLWAKAHFFWWKQETDRLEGLLQELDPTPAQSRWEWASVAFGVLAAPWIAISIATVFPALLVVAAVMIVVWLPWLVSSKLIKR